MTLMAMTTATKTAVSVRCARCGRETSSKPTATGLARVPRGWKRDDASLYCGDCWRAMYVLRAVTVGIVGPVDHTWPELRVALREAWALSTACANWVTTERYVRDVRREPGIEKMPKMPDAYLYPELRARFPALSPQTVTSIDQAATAKYRAKRYEVIWTGEAGLATYRYPAPLPIASQAVKLSAGEQNRIMVSLPLGSERYVLRLRGGQRYHRQTAMLRQVLAGEGRLCEAVILRKRDRGESATGTTEKGTRYMVLVKIVAWLPRQAQEEKSGKLFVRTAADSFLIALNAKDEKLWSLHADQLRRWEAEHRRRLARWSEDSKAEDRPVPSFSERRSADVEKYRNRLKSFVSESVARLVGYAARRKFARIRYDDSVRSYIGQFPWSVFQTALANKCDEVGIELELPSKSGDASGGVDDKSPPAARKKPK